MQAAPRLSFAPMGILIGAAVEQRMLKQGVSLTALANHLEKDRGTVRKWIDRNEFDVDALMKASLFLNYNFFQDLSDQYREKIGGALELKESAMPPYGKKSTLRVVIEMDRDDEESRRIAAQLVRDMDPNRKDPPSISSTE